MRATKTPVFNVRELAVNVGGKGTRMSDACTQCLLSFRRESTPADNNLVSLRRALRVAVERGGRDSDHPQTHFDRRTS